MGSWPLQREAAWKQQACAKPADGREKGSSWQLSVGRRPFLSPSALVCMTDGLHGPGGQQSQQGGRALECGLSSHRPSLAPAQPQPSLGETPSPIGQDAPAGKPRVTGSHPPSVQKVRRCSQSCPCPVPALGLHPQNRLFRIREGELEAGGAQSVPEAEPDFASPRTGARDTQQPPDPPDQSPGSRPAWQPPSPRAGNQTLQSRPRCRSCPVFNGLLDQD